MRVNKENIETIEYYAGNGVVAMYGAKLLSALLNDLDELNSGFEDYMKMYIDYEDSHTVYSSERVDPCPDWYGFFTLRFENTPSYKIGDYMTLHELDLVLCAIYDFAENHQI